MIGNQKVLNNHTNNNTYVSGLINNIQNKKLKEEEE